MRSPLPVACLLGFLSVACSDPSPKIFFGKNHQEVFFTPGESDKTIVFPFENIGNQTLNITHVVPDCQCASAQSNQKEFLPGEHGEVLVLFKAENATGALSKKALVFSNDPASPHELRFVAHIPEVLKISPTTGIVRRKTFLEKGFSFKVEFSSAFPGKILDAKGATPLEFRFRSDAERPTDFFVEVMPPKTNLPAPGDCFVEILTDRIEERWNIIRYPIRIIE